MTFQVFWPKGVAAQRSSARLTRAAMAEGSASQLASARVSWAAMRQSMAKAALWSRFETKMAASAIMSDFPALTPTLFRNFGAARTAAFGSPLR